METKQLQVKLRKGTGSLEARRNRKSGLVPAVLYGHKQGNVMLLLSEKEFARALNAEAKMVNLKWDNSEEMAIIKDIQYDTFGKAILHADFVRIDLTEKVVTHVPIVIYGTSQGVRDGGVLDHALKEVELECLATEIPKNIRVNVTDLALGDIVHIKDLELSPNTKALGSPDTVVVSVHFAAEEKEVSEEELASGPEVISARKPEKEESA